MALVDLVAILPTYLGAFVRVDTRMLRALRLLRIFKLSRHSSSMDLLLTVLRQEAGSILSAMFIMLIVIVLAASGIYAIEREAQPEAFDSIPKAMWWAAVTLTTVGYGDVVPVTVLGKIFGLLITVAGVGMVALPAGILASGFSLELQRRREAFRLRVKHALADGTVTGPETAVLDSEADELGISEEDVELAVEAASAEEPSAAPPCPHCGKRPR
jgi:voltage-gated potassium channel